MEGGSIYLPPYDTLENYRHIFETCTGWIENGELARIVNEVICTNEQENSNSE
jgi:hypothetical protein